MSSGGDFLRAAGHGEIGGQVDGLAAGAEPLRDRPHHDRRVQHVVVEREVVGGNVLDPRPRAATANGGGGAQRAVACNSSGSNVALPEALDRPLQLAPNADPRKTKIGCDGHGVVLLGRNRNKDGTDVRNTYAAAGKVSSNAAASALPAADDTMASNPNRNLTEQCIMHTHDLEKLLAAGPVATDGAWGTQLQERGLPVGACPDAWNLARPEPVEQIARAYVEAGSQVILTNTFGANRFVLTRHHLADQVAAINEAGVAISRRGAAGRAMVFASHGPQRRHAHDGPDQPGRTSGRLCRASRGDGPRRRRRHRRGNHVRSGGGRPGGGRRPRTGLPVVACMTFDSGAKQDRTMMGTTPEQAAEQLLAAGADLVGANCGQGIAGFVESAAACMPPPGGPSGSRPTPACREVRDGKAVYSQTAAEFAAYVPRLGGRRGPG